MNNKLQNLKDELAKKKAESPGTETTVALLLRSRPIENFSEDEVKKMLQEKGFFDSGWNDKGKGLQNQYEEIEQNGEKLVLDHTTGLTWQKSGSQGKITFKRVHAHIQKLNNEKYANYGDWRLPTLEEAMSLMEPEQKIGDLYIEPIFDKTQQWIWTSDKKSASFAWVVYFSYGACNDAPVFNRAYVRAVR